MSEHDDSSELFDASGGASREAATQQAMSMMGMETVQRLQKRVIGIQTGAEAPPDWFERTGFDTGVVRVEFRDNMHEFKVVAASSAAMTALEHASEKTEPICEQNCMIESLEDIPEDFVLRRPFKIRNKAFDAGQHWPNLWKEYASDPKGAREIFGQLITGKLNEMLKMAMMWLSKVTISDLIEADPEEGTEQRPPA